MSDTADELITAVAEATLRRDMENEDWEKGTAVNGLLATGREEYVAAAREHVHRAVSAQTADGVLNYDDPKPWMHGDDPHRGQCEPATMGHGVLWFAAETDGDRYMEAARDQYEYLRDDAKRTEDGAIAYSTGPVELWVDSIYMVCPFFARYGAMTGDEAAFDEAVSHIKAQAKHLKDRHTDLFRHEWRETPNTYPESSFWARGNGWAAAGMLDTLAYLPENHDGYESVVEILTAQCEALLKRQDRSGFWHHILDYPDSPLETSVTLQLAYTFDRAVEMGLLDEEYRQAAERAMDAAAGVVDDEGRVRRVAVPPGGPDAPLDWTSYGQGWFLMAAERLL
jgi:unsaturated rhamnogalacturonyl hydrolase